MMVSFVLPTYNEKDNIIELVKKIKEHVDKTISSYEIIVVDDDSPDKTGAICKKYFSKIGKGRVLIRKNGRGFASAIRDGIKLAKGKYVIVMDTDFSHDPKLISLLLSKKTSCDIVIASRYAKHGGGENKGRYWLSKIFNLYLSKLFRIDISDFLFGYFCIRRDFLMKHNLLRDEIFNGFGDYFIRLVYYINKAHGSFLEIPAFYKNRVYGVTKSNLLKMLITYTKSSLELLFHDLFG